METEVQHFLVAGDGKTCSNKDMSVRLVKLAEVSSWSLYTLYSDWLMVGSVRLG